jgi:hypothetical protein
MSDRFGVPAWAALLFTILALFSSQASANPCGQQAVLASARRLGAATAASVRRDQVKLQAFEQEASDVLLRAGFSSTELAKILARYQQNVPIYCLMKPPVGPLFSDSRNKISPSVNKAEVRRALRDIVVDLKIKYVKPHPRFALCSDCSIEAAWREQFRTALFFSENKNIYMNAWHTHRNRIEFANDHRALTSITIEVFLDTIGSYAG